MLKHGGRCGQLLRKLHLNGNRQTRVVSSPPIRRTYASVADVDKFSQPGAQVHGFTVKRVKHVPELHLTGLELEHDKTGAEYLHVARDDKNNVFSINFKTNPIDRTGLPHILEHVTLCGSEKYPVRDPFFKMMPRSLANFMNAFTSSDYTSYPFATTNLQDYKNLSSVYLDATLHPLLTRNDFLQEGWRLGPENPRDPATDENVKFKGVVYNEMKGQMSDASYLFYIRFREHVFPSLENSGGDPEKMTNLTHEQLVKFSKEHYHPSNAKIFTYGNFNLKEQLQRVDEALAKFDRIQVDKDLKSPIDLNSGPQSFTVTGPLDTMQPPDRQVKASITWLGCSSSDILENFSISIMMSLLMNGYGSPLYQALIESGLGTNFSPNSGYDGSAKQGLISIGLDGMSSEDAQGLQSVIQTVLREKASEAFQSHKIEGYMHQLEIALKHKTASFGMGLLDKTLPGWFNGADPIEGLSWNDIINSFKAHLEGGNYLESLVEKYLLNDKCMTFTMVPSKTYNTELEAQEETRRSNILENARKETGDERDVFSVLGKQELDLLNEQESAQHKNLDTLPTLHIQDIPKEKEKRPTRSDKVAGVDCLWRETDTNGITYFQAKHILNNLPDELRLLLPLFTECLMRLGTKTKNVGDLEAEILLKTGGISISPFTGTDLWSLDKYNEGLILDGYALDRNVPAMLDLMKTVILDIDFSSPSAAAAILELLESKNSGALDSVAESGHHFAVSSAAATLTGRGRVQEQLSGLSQIESTARLLDASRSGPDHVQTIIEKLKLIQRLAITNSSSLSLRTVCEPSAVSTNQALFQSFLSKLPSSTPTTASAQATNLSAASNSSRNLYFNLPFQVSYTGTCLQTAPYASPDKAPLTVLGQLLTFNFLHPEVREKGGAYGASASASPVSGLFTMSSYRDPNPRNSLATFKRAGAFARERDWSTRELEESKLSIFQQIDAPTSVSSDGSKEFMYGVTQEMDQQMRQRLLAVTKDQVRDVADRYLVNLPTELQSVCVLGEKKAWAEEEKGWETKTLKMSAEE